MKNLEVSGYNTRNRSNSSIVNRTRSRSNSLQHKYDEAGRPMAVSFAQSGPTHTGGGNTGNSVSTPHMPEPSSPQTPSPKSTGIKQQVIKPIKSHEDTGIFSSLLNMAHDTIVHKTTKPRDDKRSSYVDTESLDEDNDNYTGSNASNDKFYTHNDTSFSNQLDSLINNKSSEETNAMNNSIRKDISHNGDESKEELNKSGDSFIQNGLTLSPSNIHFASVRDSPIASLGNGDLTLDDFKDSRKDNDEVETKMSQIHNDKRSKRKSTSEVLSDQDSVSSDVNYSNIKFASKKRNKEFHQIFKKVPRTENLIDDFSCAISKDILVHGRLYLSENYLCFKSNILGWVTNLLIPLQEVVQIEKRSTAVLFPNGIIIRTLYQKYTFATFISRDSTFKLLTSVWHQVLLDHDEKRPILDRETDDSDYSSGEESDDETDDEYQEEDEEDVSRTGLSKNIDNSNAPSVNDGEENGDAVMNGNNEDDEDSLSSDDGPVDADLNGDSLDPDDLNGQEVKDINGQENNNLIPKDSNSFNGLPLIGPMTHAPVPLDYEKQSNDSFIIEDEFSAPLGVVFNILFGKDSSYYIKILKNQKNIQIEEDKIVGIGKEGEERNYKYIKPLGGSIGPKQTSCVICDKILKFNVNSSILVEQTTSTPDVPSGNAFKIRTRIYLYWGEKNHTKMYVVTNIEWTGKSWIKGPIEKGSIDGQKESMKILTDTVNEIVKSGDGKKQKRPSRKSEVKRSKSVSNGQAENTKPVEEPKPVEKSFIAKVNELAESVGNAVPVSIPMISPLIVGYVIMTVIFLFSVSFYNKITGGNKNIITIAGDSITINREKYLLTPSIENHLNDKKVNMDSQVQLWQWIRERSGDRLVVQSPTVQEGYLQKYSNQELRDIVRLTQLKLDKLNEQLGQ